MLIGSVFTTSTGLQAASTYLNVTGNNIANASTTGFKAQETNFNDLLYTGSLPGANSSGVTPATGAQLGTGTAVNATTGNFTQGSLEQTGQQYDLAINGNGFFKVTLADGTFAYTRDGSFSVDASGQLVTSEGYLVAGPSTVPSGTTSVTIGADGTVTATTPTGTQSLGQITLTNFSNPDGLSRFGSDLFTATPASGAPIDGTAEANGLGSITQGSLESSNVSLSTELVNLIIAQSASSFNSQALSVEDQTLSDTAQLVQ
jgi:flagellar basal-body rod protein FlgG